ncbi:DNA glycosylase [Hypoxylon cercidicola]|nr:DNA glycosylase [Hypoxylon cercidicola]
MPPRRNPKRKAQTSSASGARDGYIALPHNMGYIPVAKPAEGKSSADIASNPKALPAVEKSSTNNSASPTETSPVADKQTTTQVTSATKTSSATEQLETTSNVFQGPPAAIQPAEPYMGDEVPVQSKIVVLKVPKRALIGDKVPSKSKIVVLRVPKRALTDIITKSGKDTPIKIETKTLDKSSEPDHLETYVLPHSGRQLRPRKGAVKPEVPATELAASHSPDKKTDKGELKKRKRGVKTGAGTDEPEPKKAKRKAKKTKDNPYGLTPGEAPFPEWLAPSSAQCEVVYQILKEAHGNDVSHEAPKVIPAPSLEKTGCGEVPAVLDALLRTLLSGATTFAGAKKMLDGLKEKFGELMENGIGQGTIDWNNVRLAPLEDVAKAIHEGGLAKIKAKYIKTILDMVHQENIERREAYLKEKETGEQASVFGAAEKTEGQKDLEILKTDRNILSLDHLLGLSVDEAMRQFTKYPGIGVKTAACVILFCLQQPCFAVDTHVNKFAKWLGWAPEKATEDDVFSHLEVRCPDHLKYGLHQLFIQHGQVCDRCKRSTVEGTEDWKNAEECPMENLLNRFDKRQSKAKPKSSPKKKARDEDAEDAEDADDAEEIEEIEDDADAAKKEE